MTHRSAENLRFPTLWPSGIRSFASNPSGRDLIVGDIHGHFGKLWQSLDAIGFDASRDRLFSAGDLVDRGPESHRACEWLDQPWFHAVCGNHDFMAWRRALGEPYPEVDHRAHGGEWLDALPAGERLAIGQRLSALPLAIEIETRGGEGGGETRGGRVGVVHADCPFDDWDAFRAALRRRDPTDAHAIALADACLWSVERHARQYTGRVAGVTAVVHGHLTLAQPCTLGNAHFIDTGGGDPTGHFTFLDARTLQRSRGPGGTYRRMDRRSFR